MPHLSRPHIKLRPTRLDNIVEWTGRLLLAGMWALAAYAYLTLPDVIATHFDFSGRADAQGSKASLWMLPVIATVIYLGLTWLSSYPHVFTTRHPLQNTMRCGSIALRCASCVG